MKVIFIILVSALLLYSCNTVRDEDFDINDLDPDDEGFYRVQSGNFLLRYKTVAGEDLECILRGNTTGWLSVGFNPSNMMRDANFIIGYVEDGVGYIEDHFGTGNVSHEADVDLGGTDDVTLIDASQEGGVTTLHFRIPLDSGDPYDTVLEIGSTYPVIFASGNQNDFVSYHAEIAQAVILIR